MPESFDLANYQSPDAIRDALKIKRIAVVGLSNNPQRASNEVARYMSECGDGYQIVPVNPRETTVLGQKCYPDLLAAREACGELKLVNVFRDSSAVPAIAAEAIAIGASVLWLQLGVIHEEGIRLASGAGLNVVADRCLKIEHARYR